MRMAILIFNLPLFTIFPFPPPLPPCVSIYICPLPHHHPLKNCNRPLLNPRGLFENNTVVYKMIHTRLGNFPTCHLGRDLLYIAVFLTLKFQGHFKIKAPVPIYIYLYSMQINTSKTRFIKRKMENWPVWCQSFHEITKLHTFYQYKLYYIYRTINFFIATIKQRVLTKK